MRWEFWLISRTFWFKIEAHAHQVQGKIVKESEDAYISADKPCTTQRGRHMKGEFGTLNLSYLNKQAPLGWQWQHFALVRWHSHYNVFGVGWDHPILFERGSSHQLSISTMICFKKIYIWFLFELVR